jgi:hypothetical protein
MTENQEIWDKTEADTSEYQSHKIFKLCEEYAEFYEQFSFSIMGFTQPGTKSIINMDSYIYTSMAGTLESISLILEKARVGDAYALLRKYYDSITINIYTNIYLEDNHSIEKPIVEEITNWLNGSNTLPEYRIMSSYIRESERLKLLTDIINKDDRYKKIRNRCHDYLHYNTFESVLINDNQGFYDSHKIRQTTLDNLAKDLTNLFILHLAHIFYIHDHYMMSEDYIGALELGINPEKDSQHWVSPFVQEIFQKTINRDRPDLYKLIKEKTFMFLD